MKKQMLNKYKLIPPIHKQYVLPIGKLLHGYMNIGDRRRIEH